jgi:hypothetical protein
MGRKINYSEKNVIVEITNGVHDHNAIQQQALNEETKAVIKELMGLNYKPAQIRREICVFFNNFID